MRQLVDQHRREQQHGRDRAEDPELDVRQARATGNGREDEDAERPRDQREDDQPAVVDADVDAADREQPERVLEHRSRP